MPPTTRRLLTAALIAGASIFACPSATYAGVTEDLRAPDASLPVASYTKHGMPPVDRPWTTGDFKAAADLIERIGDKHPERLPRYGSKASGAIFARFIDPKNFEATASHEVGPIARAAMLKEYVHHVGRILTVYAYSSRRQDKLFLDELNELTFTQLRLIVNAHQADRKTLIEMPHAKTEFISSTMVLQKVTGSVVLGLVDVLALTRGAFPETRMRAMQTIETMLPELRPLLVPADRKLIAQRLENMVLYEKDAHKAMTKSLVSQVRALDIAPKAEPKTRAASAPPAPR